MAVGDRSKARRALNVLGEHPGVIAGTLVDPDEAPSGCWTVEVVIDAYAIPPRILRTLADHDLAVRQSGSHNDHVRVIASVV